MNLKKLQKKTYQIAKSKGFFGNEDVKSLMLDLHSEIDEAWEALKRDKRIDMKALKKYMKTSKNISGLYYKHLHGTFEEEIIDIILRCLSLSEFLKIDLTKIINLKLKYNKTRPYLHEDQ